MRCPASASRIVDSLVTCASVARRRRCQRAAATMVGAVDASVFDRTGDDVGGADVVAAGPADVFDPVGNGCHREACHKFRLISIWFLDIADRFGPRCVDNRPETPRVPVIRVRVETSCDRPDRRRARGCLRPRAPGRHRAPRHRAGPRPRQRAGRAVRRVHGHDPQGPRGARAGGPPACGPTAAPSLPDRDRPEPAFDLRERLQQDEKARIGAAAAALVHDGDSIVMDASTTGLAVARRIRQRGGWSQLTVITNGLRIATELAGTHGHHRADDRRPRSLGGDVRGRPPRRRPVRPDQRPDRLRRRRRLRPRARPVRRHRRGGADQALDGRGRPAGHRDRRPHEVAAGRVRDVLPDRRASTRS